MFDSLEGKKTLILKLLKYFTLSSSARCDSGLCDGKLRCVAVVNVSDVYQPRIVELESLKLIKAYTNLTMFLAQMLIITCTVVSKLIWYPELLCVTQGGTEAIKTLLRQRHRPDSTPETASASSTTAPNAEPQHQDLTLKEQAPRSPPAVPKGTHVIKAECISAPTVRAGPVISQTSCDSPLPCVNASYILDWSSGPHSAQTKKFPELPDPDSTEAWLAAAAGPHMSAVNVRTLHLAYRKLTSLPTG